MSRAQTALLLLMLCLSVIHLLMTVNVDLANTVAIFFFITLFGLWRCYVTANVLKDLNLHILGSLWLIKISLTLLLLFIGWIPELQGSIGSWSYDPQRYYYDAIELIENNWIPNYGAYYQGIIFYYASIFYFLGQNPVIPSLINCLVTLLGILFVIRFSYQEKFSRRPNDWIIALLILIPEVIWYDVMTSRENLMATLLLVSCLTMGQYLTDIKKTLTSTLFVVVLCLVLIFAVRTSMAIAVFFSMILMIFILPIGHRRSLAIKFFLIPFIVSLILLGPFIQGLFSGHSIDYLAMLSKLQSFDQSLASHVEWSENSLGLLLAPHNALEVILFLVPRMILYLVAPLPNVLFSVAGLINGSWGDWQYLLVTLTSIMMLLAAPYMLAGFSVAFQYRKKQPKLIVMYISFWSIFISIVGGNSVIHERYRLMATILFFSCAWIGQAICTKQQVFYYAFCWYGLLIIGAIFYVLYKSI